jgi:hypothetical protein
MVDIQQVVLALIAYVAPIALLALAVSCACRDTGRAPVIAVLALLPLFYLAHYHLLQTLQGWPTRASLPTQFELIAFRVTEPLPGAGTDGEILLWALADESQRPRVHRVDYTRELHEALIDAGERQQAGQPQSGRVVQRSRDGNGGPAQLRFGNKDTGRLPPKTTTVE